MVTLNWVFAAAIAAGGTVAKIDELSLFANLLKRQEPGSAAYRCHEACGQAILSARDSKDACSNDDFLTNYDTCLKCSGPDNIDIWKIYGQTLSGFGESCGLSTTPVSSGSDDLGSASSTTSTSTISTGSMTSLSVISITTAPTALATTADEISATSAVPSPTSNGAVATTGAAPANAANAVSRNGFGLYAAVTLGALYAIVH
ncbi:hypothetical protein F4782DRAFT_515297 [Xylaria castorea]|nr:hypothetical protein F4782DRAFT_515297 [Xylaria castorea]